MFASIALILLLFASALAIVSALRLQGKSNFTSRRLLVMTVATAFMAVGTAVIAVDQFRTTGRTPVNILAIVVAVNFAVASATLLRAARQRAI